MLQGTLVQLRPPTGHGRTRGQGRRWTHKEPTDVIPDHLLEEWQALEFVRRGGFTKSAKPAFYRSNSAPGSVLQMGGSWGSQTLKSVHGGDLTNPMGTLVSGLDNDFQDEYRPQSPATASCARGSTPGPTRLGSPATGPQRSFAPSISMTMLPAVPGTPGAMMPNGRLAVSDDFVEWSLPRRAIELRGETDKSVVRLIVSPTFHLFGEPFVLKFWPAGRKPVACKRPSATNGGPRAARLQSSWGAMGIFPKKPGTHLRVRLYMGSRDEPWADSGERDIYADLCMIHPSQILEAPGARPPFEWRDLPDGMLVVGAEALGNHRDARGSLVMRRATGAPPPEPPPPPIPPTVHSQ